MRLLTKSYPQVEKMGYTRKILSFDALLALAYRRTGDSAAAGRYALDAVKRTSFGVAASSVSGYELTRLLAHADEALYRAKRAGRDCVMAHDTAESGEPKAITPEAPQA